MAGCATIRRSASARFGSRLRACSAREPAEPGVRGRGEQSGRCQRSLTLHETPRWLSIRQRAINEALRSDGRARSGGMQIVFDWRQRGVSRASFDMPTKGIIGQVLPELSLGEKPPASIRIVRRSLSAQQRHRAQAAYGLHPLLPFILSSLFSDLLGSNYYYVE